MLEGAFLKLVLRDRRTTPGHIEGGIPDIPEVPGYFEIAYPIRSTRGTRIFLGSITRHTRGSRVSCPTYLRYPDIFGGPYTGRIRGTRYVRGKYTACPDGTRQPSTRPKYRVCRDRYPNLTTFAPYHHLLAVCVLSLEHQRSRVMINVPEYRRIQQSTVDYSTAQHSMVQYSAVQKVHTLSRVHIAVQHSTTQHSTAQRGSVECSTVHTVNRPTVHKLSYSAAHTAHL